MTGRRIIWAKRPSQKGFGECRMFLRSFRFIESPTPNMIVASTALTSKSI